MPRQKKIEFRIAEEDFGRIHELWLKSDYFPKYKFGHFCRDQLLILVSQRASQPQPTDQNSLSQIALDLERLNGFMSRALLRNQDEDFSAQIKPILIEAAELIKSIHKIFKEFVRC